MQVALDLVENVLRGPTEENCAGLGVLALCEVGEVLVTELGDLEQAALCTNVGRSCGEDGVDDGSTGCSCDTVVVCLADTTDSCDIGLDEEVLGEVCKVLVIYRYHWEIVAYR